MWREFKKVVKKGFHLSGYDLVRLDQMPHHTFMGLRNLPINTVIDVGANLGQFAQEISEVFPHARIHCFEPLPNANQELLRWI
jgi:hypothetical protein